MIFSFGFFIISDQNIYYFVVEDMKKTHKNIELISRLKNFPA